MFLDALKEIGLESQWVRNETVINALDNNENNWDTTDEEDDTSESDSSEKSDDDEKNEDENDEEMDCSTTQVLNKDSSSNIKWKICLLAAAVTKMKISCTSAEKYK